MTDSINLIGKSVALTLLFFLLSGTHVHSESAREHAERLANQAMYASRVKKNHPMALQYIQKAIEIQPAWIDLYYNRAFILGRAGMYGKAIQEFGRFEFRDGYSHAVRFRADCFMAVGQYDRAAKDYLSFLKKNPKDGKVWSYLVEALALMGNTKAALEAVQKGLATKSHWSKKLMILQEKILTGKPIVPHKPLSN